MAPEFDLSDWDFLPPLDDTDLSDQPPGLSDEAVSSTDFRTLDATARIEALLALQRQQAWLAAREQELLALISSQDSTGKHWSVEEVGAALRLSGGQARNRLAVAERLSSGLPASLRALSSGTINPAQARVLAEESFVLPPELLAEYETRLLDRAPEQSTNRLRQSAKRTAAALDPATGEQRRQRARDDRQVRIAPADDGMAWLMALLPAADAHAVYTRLDGAARKAQREDERTMDQLRADALVNGILSGITGELPAEQGRRPAVQVIVNLSTLIGQDDEPGWIDGYGPVSAGYARELAHDPTGTWRRLITDPVSGQPLDYGTTRYRPPQHLADHVIARDGSCTFPYCDHRARRSDLDHLAAYPDGPTSADNLQPLHRRHHNAKTEASWQATRDPATGTTTWTSPLGYRYLTRPPQRWILPDDPPF